MEKIFKAYAKINLSLSVCGKREDGFHNLENIMIPIQLHDSISIEIFKEGKDDYVTCDDINLNREKKNLCSKIIKEARNERNFKEYFFVNIHKNIPMQAGLGGGSSDAATVLLAINDILKLNKTKEEMVKVAIKVGSDVPFFLFKSAAICFDKGQIIKPIKLDKHYYVVLVKPESGLCTKTVFEKGDETGFGDGLINEELVTIYNLGNLEDLNNNIFNALEKPAILLLDEVQKIKELLYKNGAKCVLMSGAGSSVYALVDSLPLAKKITKKCEKIKSYFVELTKTI